MQNFIFDSTGKLSASIVGTSDITCDSQDLTLLAILSNGVATVRQTLSRVFSAMAADAWFRKLSRPVSPPGFSLWIISGLPVIQKRGRAARMITIAYFDLSSAV